MKTFRSIKDAARHAGIPAATLHAASLSDGICGGAWWHRDGEPLPPQLHERACVPVLRDDGTRFRSMVEALGESTNGARRRRFERAVKFGRLFEGHFYWRVKRNQQIGEGHGGEEQCARLIA